MKRWIYFILPIILCSFAYSMTLSITNPGDEDTLTGSASFVVGVSNRGDGEDIAGVAFYFKNSPDPAAGWQKVGEDTDTANDTEYSITFDTTTVSDTTTGRLFANATDFEGSLVGEASDIAINIDNGGSNNAPLFTIIPNMIWSEDEIDESLDLSDYFSDPDADSLTYSVQTAPTDITVEIINDDIARFTPNANFTGLNIVIFQASDGTDTNYSNEITLNVTPVNDPPWYTNMGNKSWTMNTNLTISLEDYFGDVDGDELNFSYTKPDNINVSIDTTDNEIILRPYADWNGTSKITFDAYDGEYNTTSGEITLNVVTTTTTTTSTTPSIDSYSPEANPTVTINEVGVTVVQEFNITKSDPEGDSLTVKWYLNNELVKEGSDGYTFSGTQEGVYNVVAKVSDGEKTVTHEWVLTLISGWMDQQETNQTKTAMCGNNKEEAGEDCKNCPQDIVCDQNYVCSDEGKCVKEKKPNRWPILIILGVIIIITIGVIVVYNKRAQREYSDAAPSKKDKEEPVAEVKDFYKEPKVKKEEPGLKKVTEPKKHKTVSNILLKNYITSSIAKKMPTSQIKENLIKKGWDKEEIEKALKEYGTPKRS